MTQHTIRLTDQELQVLNDALVNLPFKVAAPLIQNISQQLQQQFQAESKTDATDR
jgi:hypothetical protein